jgi:group I intron endonuclease
VTGLIYKIENIVDNKVYIGQTTHLKNRIYWHLLQSKRISPKYFIHRAIKKYGIDSFIISQIETISRDTDSASFQQELGEREKYWISFYEATNPAKGYNLREGGFGGGRPSDYTRKKQSESHKGKPAWNKGLKGYRKGIPKPESFIQKLKEHHTTRDYSKIFSPDVREKMSKAQQKVWVRKKALLKEVVDERIN